MSTAIAERLLDVMGNELPDGLRMVETRARRGRPSRQIPDLGDPATAEAIKTAAVSRLQARGFRVEQAEAGADVRVRVFDELGDVLVESQSSASQNGHIFASLLIDEARAPAEAHPWERVAEEPPAEPGPLTWTEVTLEEAP